MESTALTHLYAENKRLNELVVQLVAECHERVSSAKYAEVDLVNQVHALREVCDSLRSENEVLKHTPPKNEPFSEEKPDQLSDGYSNDERKRRRGQLLEKVQDLHVALDGLSSHGSHLHKMVVSSFNKPTILNNPNEPSIYKSTTNNNANETSFSKSTTKHNLNEPAFYKFTAINHLNEPLIYKHTTNTDPPEASVTGNILNNFSFNQSSTPAINPGNITQRSSASFSNLTPSISLLPPPQDTPITEEPEANFVEEKSNDSEIFMELDRLQSLLSPLWLRFGNEKVVFSGSAKSVEEELAILEEMFDFSVQYSKNSHIPVLALSSEIPLLSPNLSPLALSSIPPPPPPPPPILISPPPLSSPRIQKRGERGDKKEGKEIRGGLLAGILAVRPDSDARLLSAAKFEKERVEKKNEGISEGDRKASPMSHMDRLVRALKRVKVDSDVRMAAITQVEQEVQTRLRTVRSDRLITDTMISQQKVQLKRVGGIEALEEARMKKLEALRAQYREESLNHSLAPPTDIYQQYESSEEEYSDEDGEEEGGLASIVQGLIRTNSLREEGDSTHSQYDEYYSDDDDDDEDDTLFESLGQLVHERFANRNYIPVSEIP
eukprot:Phypoly_transcript_04068.p1 GENE.Phypoly_transcript_04068~~Phypoly_transcript_04068.p1  ORF type:complete len:607 (+),score=134.21 Phypoly_transcript_04068:85-1905(+)